MYNYKNCPIDSIAVVDDQSSARDSMSEIVIDADFRPVVVSDKIKSLDDLLELFPNSAQAFVLDFNLSVGNYATFNGGKAAAEFYKRKVPALLVTNYSESEVDSFRKYRQNIPLIYNSGDFMPENIKEGINVFIDEVNNIYTENRRPHRTLFRITEIDWDRKYTFVTIPSWNPKKTVRIPFEVFGSYQQVLAIDSRFYANINIGANKHEELYFSEIQIAQHPMGEYASFIRS